MSRQRKDRVEAEDLGMIYEELWSQLKKDREVVVQQYELVKKHIEEQPDRLNINGDVLVKSSEVLIKQTAQLLELAKLAKKQTDEDGDLSKEEIEKVREEMERQQKGEKTEEEELDVSAISVDEN